jgi:uncharacterized protein (TIGR02646 family)
MIRLERGPAPASLSGRSVAEAYAAAEDFFADEKSSSRRARFDFNRWPWQSDELRTALAETSGGRCSFCGFFGRPVMSMDTHRLRPPQGAVEIDGVTSRPHYWWLAYEWENLCLACRVCHKAQGSKFPTERKRVPVGTREDLNEREQPLLIDPFAEDPERHFAYLDSGEVAWFDLRALTTIETFDLNRPALVENRRHEVELTKAKIKVTASLLADGHLDEFAAALFDLYSTEAPFAAVRRQYVNQWAQFRPRKIERALDAATEGRAKLTEIAGSLFRITNQTKSKLSRVLDPEVLEAAAGVTELQEGRAKRAPVKSADALLSAPTSEFASAFDVGRAINRIEIRNFQGINSMDLEVPGGAGEGGWLMLVGENGAGKTATLKAIALTLMAPKERGRVLPDPALVLKHGQKSGSVRIDLTGARNVREFRFGRGIEDDRSTDSQAPLLLAAYGATRLLPGDKRTASALHGPRTGTLFDPRFPLTRPADWLPLLNRDQFDAVATGLQRILQLDGGEEIKRNRKHGFTIDSSRGRLQLADLSDGYRTMAILALDMMSLFLTTWGRLDAAEGIVLIDEIGAHLHPRWQMKVVRAMRETFPRVQFIATTHDPLCLRGLEDGEVVVLRRFGGKLIAQQEGLPSVKGLTVDQLLTSEHFGLFSTLDPETEEEFEQYYALLAAAELSAVEEMELAALRLKLERSQLLGRTRRESLALEAVDRFLAAERFATSAEELRRLPETARESVRRLLEEVE